MIADPARGSRPPSPVPGRRRAKEAPGPAGTSAPGGRRRARPLAARHPGRGGGGGGGGVLPCAHPGGTPAPRGLRPGARPRAVRRAALPSPERRQRRRRAGADQPAPRRPQKQTAPGAAPRTPRTYPVTTGAIFHKLSPKLLLSRERPPPRARSARARARETRAGRRAPPTQRLGSPLRHNSRGVGTARLSRERAAAGRRAERRVGQLSRERSAPGEGGNRGIPSARSRVSLLRRPPPAGRDGPTRGAAAARGEGRNHSGRGGRGEVAASARGRGARGIGRQRRRGELPAASAASSPPPREAPVGPPARLVLSASPAHARPGGPRAAPRVQPPCGGPLWAPPSWPALPCPPRLGPAVVACPVSREMGPSVSGGGLGVGVGVY